jgi:hypothetical protein
MCAETDFMLGTVIDALKATAQYDKSFIIFLVRSGGESGVLEGRSVESERARIGCQYLVVYYYR